jgi:hypothetical protein
MPTPNPPKNQNPKHVEPNEDVVERVTQDLHDKDNDELEARAAGPQQFVLVTDTSASDGPRTHTLQGKKFTFDPGKEVKLPWEEGAQFIPLEGFEVTTVDGVPMRSHERSYRPDEIVHMRTDQCIASLTELTAEALLARVRKYADGNGYSLNSDRYQMVAYLIDKQNTEAQAHEQAVALAMRRKAAGDETTT